MIYQLKKGSYFHVPEWEGYDVLRVKDIDYAKKKITYYWIGQSKKSETVKDWNGEQIILLQN